jgi:urea transport system permease protein
MGMLFIGVVLVFPKGLAGIYQQHVQPRLAKYIPGKTARKSWNKSKANSGAAK